MDRAAGKEILCKEPGTRLVITASAIACLAGCASQSTSPAALVADPVAAVPAATVAAEPRKTGVPAAYKAIGRNGTTRCCTRVASLGTNFKNVLAPIPD